MLLYKYLKTIQKSFQKKKKLKIFINKIDEYIKKYYNKLFQKHLRVIKIL